MPVEVNLLDLDGNYAVLCCAVERLYGSTVSCSFDVFFCCACLLEEVNNSLYALLGELLVALCGTGLLVCVTVDGELGVLVDNVLGEVLEVSLFTSAEGSAAAVEVEGDRGAGGCINCSEGAVVVEVGLTVYELTERCNLILKSCNLVLKFCILLLKLSNLAAEVFILLGCERNRDDSGNNAAVTLETGVAEVVGETYDSGDREAETAEFSSDGTIIVCMIYDEIITFLGSYYAGVEVNEEVELVGVEEVLKREVVKETTTESPCRVAIHEVDTGGRINAPAVTSLLVTLDEVSKVEEDINATEELEILEAFLSYALGAKTETVFGRNPLAGGNLCIKTGNGEERNLGAVGGVENVICAEAEADKPVVTESGGLIGTANDVAVLVNIGILLSENVHREKEACCSKNSKDSFHTFHNRV